MRFRLMLVAAALALAGHPAFATPPPDACKLLTPEEVGAAVGAAMAPGTALNGPTSSNCKWLQQGVDGLKAITVIVSTKSASGFETGKTALPPTPVQGIGDEAYFSGKSLSYMVLSAKKGDKALTVTVRGLKDLPAVQTAEKVVGKIAAGRL